ncbi:MAG: VWA domain-containing protein [Caldilineaceae bacterium]|nr:VWA domain-containing protein [Caldilineaceae bacterium]
MRMQSLAQWLFCGVLCLLLGLSMGKPMAALAQIIIDPPPGGPPGPAPVLVDPLRLEEQQVDVVIDGPLSQLHLTQVFRNHSAQTVEGTYFFPLPADAAISDFQMTVDGQVLEGQVLTKEAARRTYEEIVRQQRDPALLEYVGQGLFQVSLFPIPAGETRTLELRYSQILPLRDGLYQFRYPLKLRQMSTEPIGALTLNLTLRNQTGLRTIYSPTYDIAVERTSDTSAQVTYQATAVRPEQDFALYFGADHSPVGLNLLSYKPAGEDGYFVLLAAPSVAVAPEAVIARDLVMVVDISGSMQGDKMAQAKAAAHYVVDHLNAADRFNLIAFSTGVRLWQTTLQPVTTAQQQAAHQWIDGLEASGSTDINRSLLEALAQLEGDASARPAYLLFLTDGLPTQGETDVARILANVRANRPDEVQLRLFPFGVGYDVNTALLDTLSQELGGRSSYVQPEERIDEEVSHFYAGISTPVLSDVRLAFGDNVVIDELYPYPLPDLFAGEQLVVVGRYREAAKVDVTLHGKRNGEAIVYRYPSQRLRAADGEPTVARLWAARKVSALLAQVRQQGPQQELIDAIVELSLQYGIITPYTAAFVPEPNLGRGFPTQPNTGGEEDNDELQAAPTDMAREALAQNLTTQMQTDAYAAVGQKAVAASEQLNQLANAAVVAETQTMRFIQGRTFVQRQIPAGAAQPGPEQPGLTLWVDTLYTEAMQLEVVAFGSDCYFTLANHPQVAAWLALSPDLILVRDATTALRITTSIPTTATTAQAQACPAWPSPTK